MSKVVPLLSRLIAAPSHNPGGDEHALARLLAHELAACGPDHVEVISADAYASVLAIYGTPRLLVNTHLDTVPPNNGWSADPFVARVTDDRVTGLGACDIKGAIAAVLCALERQKPRDVAILFSGDEEATSSCMRGLLDGEMKKRTGDTITRALVCEPTRLRIGTRHRGIAAFDVTRTGEGGHSSRADQMTRPIAELARAAVALDDWGIAHASEGPPGYPGMCMNVAQLDGGVAFNVVTSQATLKVSLRPPPGTDLPSLHRELRALVERAAPGGSFAMRIDNPPFATRTIEPFRALLEKETVDLGYWTEAALLSQSGIDAVVVGPGDIAQAHAPNEWVAIDQLESAVTMFARVFEVSRGAG